jgi:hypothetical protein
MVRVHAPGGSAAIAAMESRSRSRFAQQRAAADDDEVDAAGLLALRRQPGARATAHDRLAALDHLPEVIHELAAGPCHDGPLRSRADLLCRGVLQLRDAWRTDPALALV